MGFGRLTTRLLIGGLFVGHGTQKLKGWFGGPGLEGTEQMMDGLKLHPPRRNALAAGATETACGAMLAAGLFTPLAAGGLIGVMTTAVRTVHWPNGPWNSNGGWEYNSVLIAAAALLAESGPGRASLDAVLGTERSGLRYGLGALALGAAGSMLTVELGRREAAKDQAQQSAGAAAHGAPAAAGDSAAS